MHELLPPPPPAAAKAVQELCSNDVEAWLRDEELESERYWSVRLSKAEQALADMRRAVDQKAAAAAAAEFLSPPPSTPGRKFGTPRSRQPPTPHRATPQRVPQTPPPAPPGGYGRGTPHPSKRRLAAPAPAPKKPAVRANPRIRLEHWQDSVDRMAEKQEGCDLGSDYQMPAVTVRKILSKKLHAYLQVQLKEARAQRKKQQLQLKLPKGAEKAKEN